MSLCGYQCYFYYFYFRSVLTANIEVPALEYLISNFKGLYLQLSGKLRGFQELGHAWSLMVGREGFEPLAIYVGDVNRLIAEECAKADNPSVPLSKTSAA